MRFLPGLNVLLWLALALSFASLSACARGAGGVAPAAGRTTEEGPELQLPGLLAIAAGDGVAQIDLRLANAAWDTLLYSASDPDSLYAGQPFAGPLATGRITLTGLQNGVDQYFGLAVRPVSGPGSPAAQPIPVGIILHCRPAVPIYVNVANQAEDADGLTPASAFPDLQSALLALASQGGNVWMAQGTYQAQALGWSVPNGLAIHGGFDASFALSRRNVAAQPTVLRSSDAGTLLSAGGHPRPLILDGVTIDGQQTADLAVDLDDTSAEIRSTTIQDFIGRGLRCRNSSNSSKLELRMAGCTVRRNGTDGLSVGGAYDLGLAHCRFDDNGQEGFQTNDLIAPDNQTASLQVVGCRFRGNGAQGMDVDLAESSSTATQGGRFLIDVRSCRFELNSDGGLLIDEDFDSAPLWSAQIVVRDCLARENLGTGIRVDADGRDTILFDSVKSTANEGDGIRISSESEAGFALMIGCVASGNNGAGMRATGGNKPFLASHCILAGNGEGGMVHEMVGGSATSCVAFLQPDPWLATQTFGSPSVEDPLVRNFANAPLGFARIDEHEGAAIELKAPANIRVGAAMELADDGVARNVVRASGDDVSLDREVAPFFIPTPVAWFPVRGSVVEDYRLLPGAEIAGRGLTAPGAMPVDPGTRGAPGGGPAAAFATVMTPTWQLSQTVPAVGQPLKTSDRVTLVFSSPIDALSANAATVRAVTASGAQLNVSLSASNDQVQVMPPVGGWGSEAFSIRIHVGLRAANGTPLSSPLSLPMTPQP